MHTYGRYYENNLVLALFFIIIQLVVESIIIYLKSTKVTTKTKYNNNRIGIIGLYKLNYLESIIKKILNTLMHRNIRVLLFNSREGLIIKIENNTILNT